MAGSNEAFAEYSQLSSSNLDLAHGLHLMQSLFHLMPLVWPPVVVEESFLGGLVSST
jgi:hypothetical protein